MPDRLRSRALLAVLLLLVAIAGIRAAAPPAGIDFAGQNVALATGCALEVVLAGLLAALRWRRGRAGSPTASAGPAARLRVLLSGAIMTGLIAIPIATLLAVAAKIHRRRPFQRPPQPGTTVRPVTPHRLRGGHLAHPGLDVRYLLIALLVVATIVAVIVIWRRSRGLARHDGITEPSDDTETPAELARAVDSGRVALRGLDDARAAIIRCYLAMEASLAEAGAARAVAETPYELLGRAAAGHLVDPVPAGRLTALFCEARFSTHRMPMSCRDDAEQALADLAAALNPAALAAQTAPAQTTPAQTTPAPTALAHDEGTR